MFTKVAETRPGIVSKEDAIALRSTVEYRVFFGTCNLGTIYPHGRNFVGSCSDMGVDEVQEAA